MTRPSVRRWQHAGVASALLGLAFLPGASLSVPKNPASSQSAEIAIAPAPRHGRLSVHVSEKGGAPVPNARVRILLSRADARVIARDARTDATGTVHLEALDETAAFVLADAPGFGRTSRAIVIETAARTVEVVLSAEQVLTVDVSAEEGGLPDRVDLEILGRDPLPVGARTDQAGHASVHGLPEGPYVVTARAPGYEPATLQGATTKARLVLRKLGTVLAHVVSKEGAPVPGARVFIVGADLWPPREAKTMAAGEVRIGALQRGPYALRATSGNDCTAVPVEVEVKRAEVTEAKLSLEPCRMFRVRVVEGERGGPVVGASVSFVEDGLSPFPLRAVTEPREGSAIALLGPEARFVGALSIDATGFVPRLVHVNGEAETKVELLRAGRLLGRVVDAEGRAIDGARLSVIGTDPSGMPIDDDPVHAAFRENLFRETSSGAPRLVPAGELGVVPGPVAPIPRGGASLGLAGRALQTRKADPWITREHGAFMLDPVTPGSVRVIARHPEYVEGWSAPVMLSPGGESEVTLTLRRGGAIEGMLAASDERAIGGATIRIQDARSGLERETKTADDGSFAFAAVPESVQVSVLLPRELSESLRTTVSVREGKTEHLSLRLPEPREDALVRVVDARGIPISMAQVTLLSLDPSVPLRATNFSNRDGEALLARAAGLTGRLEITAPGFSKKGISVLLEKSTRFVLEPELTASGEVRSRRGDRIEGARVLLQTGDASHQASSDKDGEFEIPHVALGFARLSVFAKGYGRFEQAITLKSIDRSARSQLGRIELEEEAIAEGRVIDADGKPVRGARVASGHVPVLPSGADLPEWVATTDAEGAFVLPALGVGELLLEAVSGGRSAVIHVRTKPGERVRGVTLQLGQRGSDFGDGQGGLAVTLEDHDGAIRIARVAERSTSERSGLRAGDVLLTVGGREVGRAEDAILLLAGPIASEVIVTVLRGESRETFRVEREPLRR